MDEGRDPTGEDRLSHRDRRDPGLGPAHDDPAARGDPAGHRDVSTRAGDGALSRVDAVKDERIRRWDVVTPSATLIGRPERPGEDVDENLRRLHDEQHPAMAGHSARMHRLEKARITHALCSTLGLTPWERDRALGIMVDLDLTAFGSQRAIPNVALVVIQHVVDAERRRRLGLDDAEWIAGQSPEALETLYDQFTSLTDEPGFQALVETFGLDMTSVNRLDRTLRDQLDEQDLAGAVFGHNPYRDPALPVIGTGTGRDRGPDGVPDVFSDSDYCRSVPDRPHDGVRSDR